MTYLRNSILATVIYYDAFDYPLTFVEVCDFLIDPARISIVEVDKTQISSLKIMTELDDMISFGTLHTGGGYYFLPGRIELCNIRTTRQKITDLKWKKFLRRARILCMIPFVRGVFASGSMALGNSVESSDFDIFLISRDKRLYICRFFIVLMAGILRIRRKPSDLAAPNKLCFNHFISDGRLNLGHQSLYTAQLYASLKPIHVPAGLLDDFYLANKWIGNYIYDFKPDKEFVRRNIRCSMVASWIAGLLEICLLGFWGDWLENILKKYQQNRILRNPITGQPGGRVVCNDYELEFHPYSFERIVIDKYNMNMGRYGIVSKMIEKDSGLN